MIVSSFLNFKFELLKQGYRYHKLRKAFSKLYRRHNELVSKFNVGLNHIKPYRNQNFMVIYDGSGLTLNDGFDVKLSIVG